MTGLRPRTAVLALALLGAGCESEVPFPTEDELDELSALHTQSARPEVDPTNKWGDNADAAALGQRLFEDKGLSRCGTVSCKSCHAGESYTVETASAEGCGGHLSERNPPSLLNVGYSRWFMWDGRADRLWSQAILPMTNPLEMDSDATVVRARLTAEPTYTTAYTQLFGKAPADESDPDRLMANVGKVLAAYQRTLNRTDAPFDADVRRFLQAVEAGTQEKDPAYLGLKTFVRKGQCVVCHKGRSLSDDKFHNLGLKDEGAGRHGQAAAVDALLSWPLNAAGIYSDAPSGTDAARLSTLKAQAQSKPTEVDGAFRTPTLRNVALSAPYMHTGARKTLEDVVDFYNEGGDPDGTFVGVRTETIVKLDLSSEEKQALVTLLKSMTGQPR
ncbi:cytochrome-c peroxidase [Corallococcus carmarthensis]|uniref:cytochrome-c peroxidase n=1 Tax=Corallococcus carmarthensis TaxID=2316728 RepID=UPI00148BF21F|nr:cytochrome c peroxidase [Corallococcus carmarthensis]NOK22070.1 cytochrome-c peroxidase [Corallococcus carmarthensis]